MMLSLPMLNKDSFKIAGFSVPLLLWLNGLLESKDFSKMVMNMKLTNLEYMAYVFVKMVSGLISLLMNTSLS